MYINVSHLLDLLIDDLKASVACAKLIVKTGGLKAWQVFITNILGHKWQSLFVTLLVPLEICPQAQYCPQYCIISKCIDLSCMCVFDMFMLIFVFAGTPGIVTVMAVRWHAGWEVANSTNKALIACGIFNYLQWLCANAV